MSKFEIIALLLLLFILMNLTAIAVYLSSDNSHEIDSASENECGRCYYEGWMDGRSVVIEYGEPCP